MNKIFPALVFAICAAVLWPASGHAQQSPSPSPAAPAAALFTPASQLQRGKLPFTVRKVFRRLARDRAQTIPFTETRTFPMSKAPVRQSGVLRTTTENGLSLAYDGAKPHVIIVDDRGLIERQPGGHERQINVADHPELGTLTDLYLNLLRGNVEKLFDVADVFFAANGRNWELGLLPHDAALARHTGKVTITGSGYELHRLENRLGADDARVIELGHIQRDAKYTPEIMQAYFRGQN